jgi:putative ABC transport system substrate-binding protein
MRRREFIGLVGGAAAWPLAAKAQEPGRIYRLGFLAGGPRDEQPNFVPMFETLRQSGFIEGQNLIVDWRAFADQVDRVPELAAELVEAKADVLYASGDFAIRALLRATATVPIVGLTEDMVGSSLVSSLARPDTNLTGVSILSTELDGKRQEILIDAVPGLQRMAPLRTPTRPQHCGFRLCRMRRAHTMSNFRCIVSLSPRRSWRPSTQRRRRAPPH